jgi:hypothetical protein
MSIKGPVIVFPLSLERRTFKGKDVTYVVDARGDEIVLLYGSDENSAKEFIERLSTKIREEMKGQYELLQGG